MAARRARGGARRSASRPTAALRSASRSHCTRSRVRTIPTWDDGARRVARGRQRVFSLVAEEAVDPAVLVGREAHVGDARLGLARPRAAARVRPRSGSCRLRCRSRPRRRSSCGPCPRRGPTQADAPAALDRSGAGHRVHAEPFEQEGVAAPVEVVAPEERHVGRGQHRVLPPLVDAARVAQPAVLELDELGVLRSCGGAPSRSRTPRWPPQESVSDVRRGMFHARRAAFGKSPYAERRAIHARLPGAARAASSMRACASSSLPREAHQAAHRRCAELRVCRLRIVRLGHR